MNYLVSIIIPVHNAERYIERCIRSLFEQTLEEVEFIFIDDHSTDKSVEILKTLQFQYLDRRPHIKLVQHTHNKGSSTSRNTGLIHAKGEYLAFCDTDDWVDKEAIQNMYNLASKEQADIVWTDFYITEKGKDNISTQQLASDSNSCIKALLTEHMHGALWNKFYKRSLFVDNNITFSDSFNMWEDLCANVKLFYLSKKNIYLSKSFYHYVQYNKNKLGENYQQRILTEMHYNTEEIIRFLKEQNSSAFDKDINYLKLAAKQMLLISSNKANFKQWKNIYPEANQYIMSYKRLSLALRLAGWCASMNLWPIIGLWIYIKRLKNSQ